MKFVSIASMLASVGVVAVSGGGDKCYNCESKNPCSPLETPGVFYYAKCKKNKFVQCSEYGECFVKKCPSGLLWDDDTKACVIPPRDTKSPKKLR